MQYKRLHIRVPATGEAILKCGGSVRVSASVINISAGGICIAAPSYVLEDSEYYVEIITAEKLKIVFSGFPVYQTETSVGIKITKISRDDLKAIYQLVQGFQMTGEFIKHIDEHGILKDWLVDEAGNDLSVTFETEPTIKK